MKFKDYLNSLVSKRKGGTTSSKSHSRTINIKTHPESTVTADCQYDICSYEDINNGNITDDQHSRTQILLARHAQLVNTIIGTRSSHETIFPSCTQCRVSHQPTPMIPPPPQSIPPPLPPKLSLEHQLSFANRNYSSTLATCSPRRECQHHQHHQQQQQSHRPTHLISPQYSIPNSNVMSSSSSSLWTTATAITTSLSKKQRSKIRTNPWIGNISTNNRSSTFIESSNIHSYQASPIASFPQPEYGIYDPTYRTTLSGLIHSESFPQTISNGNLNCPPPPPPPLPPPQAPTSSVLLHQSDSGHGFSLSSSRVIDSSSSPSSSGSSSSSTTSSSPPSSSSSRNNTSSDGMLLNGKQHHRQKKRTKKISSTSPSISTQRNLNSHTKTEQSSNIISSDSGSLKRRKKGQQISPSIALQYHHQRSSNTNKSPNLVKSSIDRIYPEHHSHSSSSHSIDDHFSLEFEEILENERSYQQRKDRVISPTSVSPRKSPFILPLDDTNMKLPSPPPRMFSPTLTKTNSRAILKHIEEIENEIRLIKNLDLACGNNDDDDDDNEYMLSPHAYPEEDFDLEDESNHHHKGDDDDDEEEEEQEEEIRDERQSIHEQVDQWVEKCLNTSPNSASRLHTECDHLSNTIKDYVVCVCSHNGQQISTVLTQEKAPLMTAFYVSSHSTSLAKRTSSFVGQPIKINKTSTKTSDLKSIHECPF